MDFGKDTANFNPKAAETVWMYRITTVVIRTLFEPIVPIGLESFSFKIQVHDDNSQNNKQNTHPLKKNNFFVQEEERHHNRYRQL
jgi:hypothetical protein